MGSFGVSFYRKDDFNASSVACRCFWGRQSMRRGMPGQKGHAKDEGTGISDFQLVPLATSQMNEELPVSLGTFDRGFECSTHG